MSQPSVRDVELLSAYLDSQLSKADSARLETRIKNEPQLRVVYDDLRSARGLLGRLPARRAPRNFVLTAQMAGIKPPLPAAFPFFRLASVFAVFLLFAGYALDLSVPATATLRAQAPELTYGAGAAGNAPSAAIAPAATQPVAADTLAPAPSAEFSAPASFAAASSAAASSPATFVGKRPGPAANQTRLQPTETAQPLSLPVPSFWLSGLLVLAVLSGSGALLLRTRAENAWRRANALKPAPLAPRDWLLIGLAALLVLLLAAGIYWMATTTFTIPFPQP